MTSVPQRSQHQLSPIRWAGCSAVLEDIQQRANPGINTTIKDKYFNSASATPAVVFPILGNLAQKHLQKLEPGCAYPYEQNCWATDGQAGREVPRPADLPQQGAFQLGYYHQT
ncbi:MAG: type I-C CRISPR-associated protein Cas8c/Csd1 [Oscillospiraceae bacterium]